LRLKELTPNDFTPLRNVVKVQEDGTFTYLFLMEVVNTSDCVV